MDQENGVRKFDRGHLSIRSMAQRLSCTEAEVRLLLLKFGLRKRELLSGEGTPPLTSKERADLLVRKVSAHRRKLKARSIEFKGGRCILCGYNKCNAALEFHHLDPKEKAFGLSRKGVTRSWESVRSEIKKCVLVCANCHREVEAGVRRLAPAAGINPGPGLSRLTARPYERT